MRPFKTLVFALIAMAIVACATFTAREGTIPQKIYGVTLDYEVAIAIADDYVNRPNPNLDIKQSIKNAELKATPAIETLAGLARGQSPDYCAGVEVIAPPENVDHEFAIAACRGDIPMVLIYAREMVRALALLAPTDTE